MDYAAYAKRLSKTYGAKTRKDQDVRISYTESYAGLTLPNRRANSIAREVQGCMAAIPLFI